MIKFLLSQHTRAYIAIGVKYHVWPERVYNLAHGKISADGQKNHEILHELCDLGIVHRHREKR